MARFIYQGTFKDQNGKVVGAATTANTTDGTVSVYLAGTDTAASIYTAASGGTAVNSVETDDYGHFLFYVDTGDYGSTQKFKITLTHADFLSKSYDNIQIFPYSATHISSDGSDHSFIDQSVISSAAPVFTGTNFTGIPASGISSTSRTGLWKMLVTGPGSSDGMLAKWNADGDLISSSFAPTDVDYTFVSNNSTGTDITQAEIEELSDGSLSTLHRHGWTYGSQVSTVSSTNAVELISNVSTDAQEVEILFNGVGVNTDNTPPKIQLGDSGGYEETGYEGSAGVIINTASLEDNSTSGILICTINNFDSGNTASGVVRLSRWDVAEETWVASGGVALDVTGPTTVRGVKTLSGNLTSIRLVTGSTAAFDAGEARVRYR